MIDNANRTDFTPHEDALANTLIRDLVAAYPDTMAMLAPLGIDLCCGGGHALGEALSLHGIDHDTVLPQIAGIIQASSITTAGNRNTSTPHIA